MSYTTKDGGKKIGVCFALSQAELLRLKARAVEEDRSVSSLIREALRELENGTASVEARGEVEYR